MDESQRREFEGLPEDLVKIFLLIDQHPDYLPQILAQVGKRLNNYYTHCKRQNDHDLREALGDACHILGMKKRPADMKNACMRIERTIFPYGIERYHHEGEKQFYRRYLEPKP